MKALILIATLLTPSAYGKKPVKIYDLGDVEVEGEFRRPMIHLVQKQQHKTGYLKLLLKQELATFEDELLDSEGKQRRPKGAKN